MLWRLLRLAAAPYYVLGSREASIMRLRIYTPWDWSNQFVLRDFAVSPSSALQPRVEWRATVEVKGSGEEADVEGHAEVRWSHGRFCGDPEAKIYLDTPHDEVPGYATL